MYCFKRFWLIYFILFFATFSIQATYDTDFRKYNELMDACKKGYIDTVKELVREGTPITPTFRLKHYWQIYDTALHAAADGGNTELAAWLLDQGAKIDAKDEAGRTPIHMTPYNKDIDMFNFLLERGADVNIRQRPLHWPFYIPYEADSLLENAISHNNSDDKYYDYIKAILKSNAKFEKRILTKSLLRHMGCPTWRNKEDFFKVLRLLVKKGADINAKDEEGDTVLQKVFRITNNIEYIKPFIDLGADLEVKYFSGETSLIKSILYNTPKITKILLDAGAKLTAIDNKKNNILHLIAMSYWSMDKEKFIATLKERNELDVLINQKNADGKTPLYIAMEYERYKFADLLIEAGADPKIRCFLKAPYQVLDKYSTSKKERRYYKKLKRLTL